TDRMYAMAEELRDRVRAAALARAWRGVVPGRPPAPAPAPARRGVAAVDAVLVGTSSGGPHALTILLPSFPADFPVPIVVVVHMPVGYTPALARRLDSISALTVLVGDDEIELTGGMAVLAPFGANLGLVRTTHGLGARLEF